MVKILSRIFAVLITVVLVIILYPIAAILWVLGFIGKLGTKMFEWTNKTIKKLWNDIKQENLL